MPTHDEEYPTCIRTFATLRFYHDDASPDAVTRALGLFPTEFQKKGVQKKGENVRRGKVVHRALSGCFLRSKGEVESRDVRCHIDWILDRLDGKGAAIANLHVQGWRSDVFCFWLGIGSGGPMLDPAQMGRLSELDLPCGFDVYAEKSPEP